MAAAGTKRKRSERVIGLSLPPSKWERAWRQLRQRDVVLRVALAGCVAGALCCVMRVWNPPLGSRAGPYVARDGQLGYPMGSALQTLDSPESLGSDALQQQYRKLLAKRSWWQRLGRSLAMFVIVSAAFATSGVYLYFRERRLIVSLQRLAVMLTLLVATMALGIWAAGDARHAEIIPVLIFAQTLAIAYNQELALLFGAMLTFLLTIALGFGLGGWLLLAGAMAVAVVQLNRVRSRTKLIYVGLYTAAAAAVLRLALALLNDVPLSQTLLMETGRMALWIVLAGFLMTGLLPFVERSFGVLTDMSLLELTDLSHPLLQELARRAPSTYNHSINVGAIAEAAADAIGARGLLVRVGAYFHDIGKMLKPEYFIENQGESGNRHEALEPHLSSLVIIAHVKDGVDLARRHHLPEPIIDFIEQHHGTTLVEYFYGRAVEKSEQTSDNGDVDESTFRYPGPSPQTKEAAVLMLADAVESATRSLKDPAPSRIENLVRSIAERKLEQGQFDESDLTLRELRTIEDSIIKSLIATYHGRIKYPQRKPGTERRPVDPRSIADTERDRSPAANAGDSAREAKASGTAGSGSQPAEHSQPPGAEHSPEDRRQDATGNQPERPAAKPAEDGNKPIPSPHPANGGETPS